MSTRSIRFRLTVWYALVLAAALCLFSGLIWLSLRQRLIGEVDRDLAGSAGRFTEYFRRQAEEESGRHLQGELEEFCQALPATSYLELRGRGGFFFQYPKRGGGERHNMRTTKREFSIAGEAYTLQAATSMQSIRHTLELLRFLLLSLIPAVVAIACIGGAWLSRRALRPVDEITGAAKTIGIENLSQRLSVPATGDELARLTEVWNTMLARLETAVTTLSQFAADASHELRTPLAVIRTSAELALRRARSPESYRETLAEIASEAERMTQLVEDLLFLARSDSEAVGMPMQILDLSGILREVVNQLHDLAEVRGIRMKSVPEDAGALVCGNAAALRRLFLVLVDNAIKYSPPGSEVTIDIKHTADGLMALVQDEGVGIPADDLPHIFQRFYRADKARTHGGHSGGHGLGLSLASRIAEAHGAQIEVLSVEGAGSTFFVGFPLRPARYTLTIDAHAVG